MAACVAGRVRDCLKSPCSFVSGIWGRVCVISINVGQR